MTFGPFLDTLTPDQRNERLDWLVHAFPSVHTKPLEIARRWLKVARLDWCEESAKGLSRAINDLPTRDHRGIISRYSLKEAASREREKARGRVAV